MWTAATVTLLAKINYLLFVISFRQID
ncbi:MAG: hypothetical protein ACOY3J_10135 [Bacillota bacterium]